MYVPVVMQLIAYICSLLGINQIVAPTIKESGSNKFWGN